MNLCYFINRRLIAVLRGFYLPGQPIVNKDHLKDMFVLLFVQP